MLNPTPRGPIPNRAPIPGMPNNAGMQQSMRFNLGTLPYTFMQMGPDGITLNQVSASVVADVQASNPSSQQQSSTTRSSLSMLFNLITYRIFIFSKIYFNFKIMQDKAQHMSSLVVRFN